MSRRQFRRRIKLKAGDRVRFYMWDYDQNGKFGPSYGTITKTLKEAYPDVEDDGLLVYVHWDMDPNPKRDYMNRRMNLIKLPSKKVAVSGGK